MTSEKFSYDEAFKCNIGIRTREEQEKCKNYRIAIAGIGGVGSNHIMNLVRTGYQKFSIIDPDVYELRNFNRQYGATTKTLGKSKVETMVEKVLEINPEAEIRTYNKELNRGNLEEFLKDTDITIDGLDAYIGKTRRDLINGSLEKGIPVISAGPIGYGTICAIFSKDGPNFDEFFGVNEKSSETEINAAFFSTLFLKQYHRKYMKGNPRINACPSIMSGLLLSSAFVQTATDQLLLKRGDLKSVPYTHQIDLFKGKSVCKRVLFGQRNPILKIKKKIVIDLFEGRNSYITRFFLKEE